MECERNGTGQHGTQNYKLNNLNTKSIDQRSSVTSRQRMAIGSRLLCRRQPYVVQHQNTAVGNVFTAIVPHHALVHARFLMRNVVDLQYTHALVARDAILCTVVNFRIVVYPFDLTVYAPE